MNYNLDVLTENQLTELKELVKKSLQISKNPKLGRLDEYSANSTFLPYE